MEETRKISFAAINPFVESHIVDAREQKSHADWYQWGEGNAYPDYLLHLYRECAPLQSAINGLVDYIYGDGAVIGKALQVVDGKAAMNRKGETVGDIVRQLSLNYAIYHGLALQVIRNAAGEVAEVYVIPTRYIRTDKENEVFWYSEEWGKSSRVKTITYPKFIPGTNRNEECATSILYWRGNDIQVYPMPIYAAAVKACETAIAIDDFHLNEISNGFMGSYIVNFNNGQPTDQIKDEIERDFNDKFAGSQNAGRIMMSWNNDKEHAVTLQKMEVADYGEKYDTLSTHCRRQIFTAFRANENLFGMPTASGFNSEEYDSAFRLFNRTMVKPAQGIICALLDKATGIEGNVTINPFTM